MIGFMRLYTGLYEEFIKWVKGLPRFIEFKGYIGWRA